MVLAPLEFSLTYKSNKDSVKVLNGDAYINWFKKIMGTRSVRHIAAKEVIIHDPDYPRLTESYLINSQQSAERCLPRNGLEKSTHHFKLADVKRR